MNFIKSFSITFVSTILLTLFGIANNIIITRQIGVDGRGKYAVILNFILLLSLLLGEGLRRSNTILIGNNKNYLSDLLKKSFSFSLFLLLLLLALAFGSSLFTSLLPNIPEKLIILAVISVALYVFWQSIQSLFLGIQRIVYFNILQVSSIFLNLIINLFGIYFLDFELTEIIYVYLVSTIITVIIALFGMKQPLENFGPTITKVTYSGILNLGSRSVIAGLFSFAIIKSGIFFSNYYLDSVQTGLYSIALLFFEIIQKLPITIGTLVLSRTVIDTSSSNSDNTSRLVRAILFIDLVFILGLLLFGRLTIIFMFGVEFADSMILIEYLFPAFLLIGPASVLYAFFMGKGYPKKLIILNGIAAILTIGLLLLFIESYGIAVVPIITSIVLSGWAITLMVFFKLETGIPFNKLLFMTKSDINYMITGFKSLLHVE